MNVHHKLNGGGVLFKNSSQLSVNVAGQMSTQDTTLIERAVTNLTLVRTFTRVDPTMLFNLRAATERLAAHLTHVRLDAEVSLHVRHQLVLDEELFTADVARERTFLGMSTEVTH